MQNKDIKMADFKNSMFYVLLAMFINIVAASEAIKEEIPCHILKLPIEMMDRVLSFKGVSKQAVGICRVWENIRLNHIVYKITSDRLHNVSSLSYRYHYLVIDNEKNSYSHHIPFFRVARFPNVEIRNADIDDQQILTLIKICKSKDHLRSNTEDNSLKKLVLKNTSVTRQPTSGIIDITWIKRSEEERTDAHTRKIKKSMSYIETTVNYLF